MLTGLWKSRDSDIVIWLKYQTCDKVADFFGLHNLLWLLSGEISKASLHANSTSTQCSWHKSRPSKQHYNQHTTYFRCVFFRKTPVWLTSSNFDFASFSKLTMHRLLTLCLLTYLSVVNGDSQCTSKISSCSCSTSAGEINLKPLDNPGKPMSWQQQGAFWIYDYNPCTGKYTAMWPELQL